MRFDDHELPAAVFERDGDRFVPTAIARGPWSDQALHGGPPTALLGRALLVHEAGGEAWHLGRLTVELVRPVPVAPLTVEVCTAKPGRRVQVLDAVLRAGDLEVALARGVRFAGGPAVALPPPAEVVGSPAALEPHRNVEALVPWMAFGDAVEMRFEGADWMQTGPKACWFRLRVPLIAGDRPLAQDVALCASDFPNGISAIVPFDRATFINPDLTVTMGRAPVGEWVRLDAVTRAGEAGVGWAEALIADEAGPLGRAVQTLLFSPR